MRREGYLRVLMSIYSRARKKGLEGHFEVPVSPPLTSLCNNINLQLKNAMRILCVSEKTKNTNLNRQFLHSYSQLLCPQYLKGGNNCPLTYEQIHRMLYRPIMEYYSALKRN